ncbi:MAG: phosphoribosylamine--glycine ligase [Actinomycetota bacterium]|nr:phosphoribosylamine--glycine ligase [Actinomycetota bacterium]
MKVCVVGADGRAHVLAQVLGRTAEQVVVCPGSPGIPGSLPADPLDVDADLFVVGPEQLLVDGLADRLRARGRLVFGPGADGARLEGSKRWMKAVLADAGVPTARSGAFTEAQPAIDLLRQLGPPWVVKTDGLAAGKGVLVTESLAEAEDDVRAKLSGVAFGDAGRTVVIEEGMVGPELSLLAVCDGTTAVPLAPARDHKRAFDGDAGPNTGGMGAYSPVAQAPPDLVDAVMDRAVLPTLHALRRRGIDYRGVLYAGLMLTPEGTKVLEYNIRFGDPEAQVVLPRLSSDLTALLASAACGRLGDDPSFGDDAAVTVVCATEGYPGAPRPGDPIAGMAEAEALDGVTVHCAGVGAGPDGGLVTAGGRVLDVTALGPSVAEARRRAYEAVGCISWPGLHHRTDIAIDEQIAVDEQTEHDQQEVQW